MELGKGENHRQRPLPHNDQDSYPQCLLHLDSLILILWVKSMCKTPYHLVSSFIADLWSRSNCLVLLVHVVIGISSGLYIMSYRLRVEGRISRPKTQLFLSTMIILNHPTLPRGWGQGFRKKILLAAVTWERFSTNKDIFVGYLDKN